MVGWMVAFRSAKVARISAAFAVQKATKDFPRRKLVIIVLIVGTLERSGNRPRRDLGRCSMSCGRVNPYAGAGRRIAIKGRIARRGRRMDYRPGLRPLLLLRKVASAGLSPFAPRKYCEFLPAFAERKATKDFPQQKLLCRPLCLSTEAAAFCSRRLPLPPRRIRTGRGPTDADMVE